MKIEQIAQQFSEQIGLPLKLIEVYQSLVGIGSLMETARVLHNGKHYGTFIMATDSQGIRFCLYEGKHPSLNQTDEKESICLSIQRDEKGLFRVDYTLVPFLDFEKVEETEENFMRILPHIFGELGAYLMYPHLGREDTEITVD